MKNICKSLILVLLIYSCRDDGLKYSCDPALNEMVTTHMQEYVQFTVNDLIKFDLPAQQAIFRTYTPEKKRAIWLEKIHFLLDHENYTQAEYDHVSKLLGRLNENFFNPDTLKTTATKRSQLNAVWKSYAKDSLGWSDKNIAFVAYRLYTQQEQFDAELKALLYLQRQAIATGETGSGPCYCASELYCGNGTTCRGGNCNPTSDGCGFLSGDSCTGICQ